MLIVPKKLQIKMASILPVNLEIKNDRGVDVAASTITDGRSDGLTGTPSQVRSTEFESLSLLLYNQWKRMAHPGPGRDRMLRDHE